MHFESQTTNKRDDIKRFLYHDASLYYKEKRKVRTIVIYSADIENVETYIDAGIIKYMKNLDVDEKLNLKRRKTNRRGYTNVNIYSFNGSQGK